MHAAITAVHTRGRAADVPVGAQTRGGLERRPEGERPTGGDLLAADRRGFAGRRDAESKGSC